MDERAIIEFGTWGQGVYLDRWSFVHFAWGFMLASVFRVLGISKKWAYIFSLMLMLGWEFVEWFGGSHDRIANSACDVILASAGFWLMHYQWPKLKLTTDALVVTVILAATVVAKVVSGA
jgi:hypothetical protein